MKEFHGIVIDDILKVRSNADIDESNVIGELSKDTDVRIDVKTDDFYLIYYNDGFAYVQATGINEV